ncbi:MAG: CHAT domain-containing protein [Gemmatimonadaceae bacterium]
MPRSFILSSALALAVMAPASSATDPRALVAAAERAVERGDGEAALESWRAAVRSSPGDRAAHLALATVARRSYDYALATREYEESLHTAPLAGDRMAGYARLGLASGLAARGMFADAAAHYAAARSIGRDAGDVALQGEAMIDIAKRRTGSGVAALLDSAARLIPASELELRAALLCRRALLVRADGWNARIAAADSGIALARRAGSTGLEGRCTATKATVLGERGNVSPTLFLVADSLLALAHDDPERANALSRAGFKYVVRGDYGAARATLRRARQIAARVEHRRYLGNSMAGLAAVALRVNDFATAEAELNSADSIAHAAGDTVLLRLVQAYQADMARGTGDAPRARVLYEIALASYVEHGDASNEWVVRRDLAQLAMRQRDWTTAAAQLDSARRLATSRGLTVWLEEQPEHEGRLALMRGDAAAARRLYTEALGTLRKSQHSLRYGVRARLAEAHAALGELDAAERELTAASDELDAWRATLADDDLRLLAANLCACADQDTGVPRVLAALAADGRVGQAFALAERRRARELVNRMMQAEVLRDGRSADGELRTRVQRQGEPIDADRLAAALPDSRTALLEFVTGPDGAPTTLFVVTRDGVRAVLLPPLDTLAPRVQRWLAFLEGGDSPDALARSLGAALLDSAQVLVGPEVTRLVIVPDGLLHRVPFDALRLRDGRFAVQRFAIASSPSATVASELWRRGAGVTAARAGAPTTTVPPGNGTGQASAAPVTASVLALGDPTFASAEEDDGDGGYRASFDAVGGLVRLAGSGREARMVASFTPDGQLRLREEASEAFLKHAPLDDVGVIHLATHAMVDETTVARTALALAPGDGEDGFLSAGDVAALSLGADLVVLSACRTAGGHLLGGEGIWGLTGPLLEAGARAVVATGWRIGDDRSVRLMREFYTALADGQDVAGALQTAKLAAIARGERPETWAAFSVVGDPMVRVALVAPTRTNMPGRPALLAIAGLLVVVAVGVVGWRYRAGSRSERAGELR